MSPVKDDLSPAQYLQNQDHLYQAFKSFWPQHSVNIARLTALLSNTSYCGQQTLLLLACLLWIWVWNTVFTVRLHTLSQHMFCFVLWGSSSTCQAVNKKVWSIADPTPIVLIAHCHIVNIYCVSSCIMTSWTGQTGGLSLTQAFRLSWTSETWWQFVWHFQGKLNHKVS